MESCRVEMRDLLAELGGRDATGRGVRIAIVDSGVETDHPWIRGHVAASYSVIEQGGSYHVLKTRGGDLTGHGTAVAGQVRRFAPQAELVSVQVLGGGLKANSESLLHALRWLATQEIDIMNLSLSTMREQFALLIGHAIDDLNARDVTCVCARGYHRRGRAYPTDFASTVAVSYGDLHPSRLVYRPHDPVEFDAAGQNVEVAWKGGGTRFTDGSSFACPLVTGLAARIRSLQLDLSPYEVKSWLKRYALRQEAGWREPWMDAVAEAPRAAPEAVGQG